MYNLKQNKIGGRMTANCFAFMKNLAVMLITGQFRLHIGQSCILPPTAPGENSIVDLAWQTLGLLNPILHLAEHGQLAHELLFFVNRLQRGKQVVWIACG